MANEEPKNFPSRAEAVRWVFRNTDNPVYTYSLSPQIVITVRVCTDTESVLLLSDYSSDAFYWMEMHEIPR